MAVDIPIDDHLVHLSDTFVLTELGKLGMAITEITLSSLKQAKNAVIGNPTAKRALAQDEALIGTLVNFIHDPEASSEPSDDLRIEAAHILASLSYGSTEALRTLLRANALQALLLAISHTTPSTTSSLRAALARALKTLGSAIADVIGPAQWGLQEDHPDIVEEARAALESLFQIDALDTYLPLLTPTSSSSSPQISSSIAHLLASTLRLPLYRNAVAEWSPPAERQKESVVRGKRGWEKSEGTSSHPSRGGGWVARVLVGLLERKDVKHQEAALLALASLAKDNPAVATSLTRPTTDHPPVLTTVLSCCKSRATDLQLAACLCATNIFRASASNAPPHTHLDQTAPMTVIHVMNGLIEAEGESPRTRMKACYIIYYLVADDKDLCQLAYERGSLAKLAALVKSITPSDTGELGWGWDEDEPESVSSLRAAALTSTASISLFDTDIRASISGPLRLIPTISLSLSSSSPSVRFAACQCVRALSRAVAVLRTNLVDSGLGLKVYEGVFCREGEDCRVLHAAASVICNIISDFSPLQATLLERGVIERLVRLLQSGEESLMLDALWAFKNLLYKSTLELKGRVMRALCWGSVASLLVHDNPGFQEQTFHILRNLADSQEGIAMIFDELGSEFLLSSLSHALESDNEDVLRQAVYLTGNLSNSPTHSPLILAHTPILHALRLCLVDAKPDVRRPAVTAVLQLIKANPSGAQKALCESGIDSTLRHMCDYGGGIGYGMGGGFGGGIGGMGGGGGGGGSPTAGRFHGGGGFGHMGVEDDREVKEKAREALNRLQVVFPELE